MTTALVLCRTPYQAYLLQDVLDREGVTSYELLYYTHQDSAEDRHYFPRLADRAHHAEYVHVPPPRFDLFGYVRFYARARRFLRDLGHDMVVLASIDNYVFSAIARKQAGAAVVSFDDGMSNILSGGLYRQAGYGGRGRVYRILFGAHTFDDIKRRIARHYTIYPQFENIVPKDRVRPLSPRHRAHRGEAGDGPVFFIGQPFRDVMDTERVDTLTRFLRERHIDHYVRHPRETTMLDLEVPELDKGGLIAEEAIYRTSRDTRPTIIGWHSNVMFNIDASQATKLLLVFENAENRAELTRLGEATGCEIVLV